MNKLYRLVWNENSPKALVLALAGIGLAWAGAPAPTQLPTGAQVVGGQAMVTQAPGSVLQVQQSSQAAIINWQSFNLGSAASVNFLQPSASSSTLNRVQDSNPSQIFGRITAPGQVFFTNPSGIYFGPSASVDVGGLVATTHSLSDADFMAGNYHFARNGASGSIVNAGELKAALGGYIALLAPEVRNQGVILAQMGTVALAAGELVTLDMLGTQLSSVRVSPATIKTLVDNASAVLAPGGLIILSAQAADQLQGSVVNNSGSLVANGLALRNGRVVLEAGSNGAVQAGGTLNVRNDAGSGGQITITGKDIVLPGGAQLLASGSQGGGTVLVGGDWQGSGTLQQATTVRMEAGAVVDASAIAQGDGGKVVLWSDVRNSSGATTAAGSILARGGALGGNGGRVETSGHHLDVHGVQVNAGRAGQWLLDPDDIVVATTGGTITPASITGALNGGTDVTLNTASIGSGNGDITVTDAIVSTGAGAGALSLVADRDIYLNANITLTGTGKAFQATAKGDINHAAAVAVATNNGAVTYRSDSDANGAGAISLDTSASVTTNGGNVVFEGSGGINITDSSISTGAGSIRLTTDNLGISNPVGLTVASSGTLTIEPVTSFGVQLNTSVLDLAPSLTGLTLGKPGNAQEIAVDGNAIVLNGPISIYGSNIYINADLNITQSGAAILAKASGNIVQNSNKAVGTNAGDITYWADSNGDQVGAIRLQSDASVSSSGGNVFFGGGLVLATGYAATDGGYGNGVELSAGASVSAGSGNVTLRGKGYDTGSYSDGVRINGAGASVSGSNITLVGHGSDAGTDTNRGVTIEGGASVIGSGTVSITGTGGATAGDNNFGVSLGGASTLVAATGTGSVTIHGTGGGSGASGSNHGVYMELGATMRSEDGPVSITGTGGATTGTFNAGVNMSGVGTLVEASASGNVSITATGGGGNGSSINYGFIVFSDAGVQTHGGSLDVHATGGSGTTRNNGVQLQSAIGSTATGPITLTGIAGSGGSGGDGIELGFGTVTNNGSAIRLVADSLSTFGAASLTVVSNGALTIEPVSSSFSGPLSTSDIDLGNSLTGLTLGKSGNTAAITVANATSIAGPVSVYGGNIVVNATLAAAGNVLLDADTGGQLSFTGAGVQLNAGVSTSANGNVTITGRGGNDAAGNQFGIGLNNAGIAAGGTGTVTLTGRGGNSTGDSNYGIYSNAAGAAISSANGNISLTGYGGGTGATTKFDAGVYEGGGSSLLAGGAGSVSITGTGGAATSSGNGMRGIHLSGGSINSSGGAITLTGTGGANATGLSTTQSGIQIDSLGAVGALSGNAPITLVGTDTHSGANGIRFFLGTLGGNSYSGNILLRADGVSQGAATPATINTSGTLGIEPINTSFATTLDTTPLALSRLTGLTLGKPGNTGAITLGRATSIAGPISLYGGNLAINAALTATGSNTITLASSGAITEGASGSVVADQLLLQGGNATLTNAGNNIGTLAASAMGSLSYTDSDALTLGTVGSTHGIAASGAINVATLVGDLTVAQGVATSNTSASALVLNAGQSAVAGTASGGNILMSGSPVLSVGTGGTEKLYSGSVSGSTGLTALVGAGSGHFRYHSDESANGYTLALATDVPNAIYREQPTITVTADSQVVTYGTAPTLTSSVGTQNGDTAEQALGTAASIAVSGTTSASGNYTANVAHALTASGAVDQLGYAVSYAAPGSLTVNPKTVTLVASKTYDGSTSLAGAVTLGGLVGSETLSYSAATASDAHVATAGKYINALTLADGALGGVATNYQLPTLNAANAPVSITPRSISLTSLTAANKSYDGTAAASITGGNFANMVGNETLAISGSGTFDNRNAGTGKTVTVADVTALAKADGIGLWNDYHLGTTGSATGTANVAQKAVTLTAGSVRKAYDGLASYSTLAADLALLSSQLGVSNDTLSAATMVFSDPQAGTGKALTLADATVQDGNGGANYLLSLVGNNSSMITPLAPQVPRVVGNGRGSSSADSGFADATGGATPANAEPAGTSAAPASVLLQVVREATEQSGGFTLVYVPTALRNAAQGFRFTLPQTLLDDAPGGIRVRTLADLPLPDWLHFDSQTGTFEASAVPPGGLPLRVRVLSGGRQQVLELLEVST